MSLKRYLLYMSFITLVCWIAFGIVVTHLDPYSWTGQISFYLSLFLSLAGTFSLAGFLGRVFLNPNQIIYRHVGVSLRQAILASILIDGVLFLQGSRLLNLTNFILLSGSIIVLEIFFSIKK